MRIIFACQVNFVPSFADIDHNLSISRMAFDCGMRVGDVVQIEPARIEARAQLTHFDQPRRLSQNVPVMGAAFAGQKGQ